MGLGSTAVKLPTIGLAAGVALLSFSADLRGDEAPAPGESALRGMLEAVPAYFVTTGSGSEHLHFVDHEAAAMSVALSGTGAHEMWAGPHGGTVRASVSALQRFLMYGIEGEWRAQIGFDPQDMRQSLELSLPGESYLLLRMKPGVTEGIGPVLEANGYEPRPAAPHLAWGRGEDRMMDLANRDPMHPFGGEMGRSTRVGVMGDMVVQGPVWLPVLAFMSDGQPSAADVPAMAALLEGLEAWGLPVVQAFIPLKPEMLVDAGEVPWTAAALIDGFTIRKQVGQLVLVFPDLDTARDAADHIAAAWDNEPSTVFQVSYADNTGWQPDFELVGEGPTVLVMTLAADPDWSSLMSPNSAYETLYRALMMRDMVFLPRS